MATPRPARAHRTPGVPGDGPPPLDLEIRRRLLTLLLANALPLLAVAVVAIGVAQGKWTLKANAGRGLVPLLMTLGACVVLVVSSWIILPLGRWLRDRPRWHFRHGSRMVWALPYAAGWCAWVAFWVAGVGAALGALAMIGMCLVRLAEVWLGR
jgi:hypothetical protein